VAGFGLSDGFRQTPRRNCRELPRLAEIEVWSIGDNIGIGTLERGGRTTNHENNGTEQVVIDGGLYSKGAQSFIDMSYILSTSIDFCDPPAPVAAQIRYGCHSRYPSPNYS